MKEEYIDIIDENDNVLYKASRTEVIEKDLLHRAAAVMVSNSKNEILIHQRAKNKDVFPGFYDFTVGGRVSSGESYEKAAIRELEEEIGIRNPKIKFLFKHNFFDKPPRVIMAVYSCKTDGPFKFQEGEIEKGYFIALDKLKDKVNKENFCPGCYEILQDYWGFKKTNKNETIQEF